jgi:hypothetical protein
LPSTKTENYQKTEPKRLRGWRAFVKGERKRLGT